MEALNNKEQNAYKSYKIKMIKIYMILNMLTHKLLIKYILDRSCYDNLK